MGSNLMINCIPFSIYTRSNACVHPRSFHINILFSGRIFGELPLSAFEDRPQDIEVQQRETGTNPRTIARGNHPAVNQVLD